MSVTASMQQGNRMSIAGTANYIAPEMLRTRGDGGYSFNIDVWSLGMTVVEMLTAAAPFEDFTNQFAIMFQIAQLEAPPEIPKFVGEDTRSFLLACLQPDPARRPNAQELLGHAFINRSAASERRNQQQQQQTVPQLQRSKVEEQRTNIASGFVRSIRRITREESESYTRSKQVQPQIYVMSDKDGGDDISSFLKQKMHGERESAQILQKEVEEWQKQNQRRDQPLHEQYEEKKSFLGKLLRWDVNKEKRKKKYSEKDLESKADRLAQELANLRARSGLEISLAAHDGAAKKQRSGKVQVSPSTHAPPTWKEVRSLDKATIVWKAIARFHVGNDYHGTNQVKGSLLHSWTVYVRQPDAQAITLKSVRFMFWPLPESEATVVVKSDPFEVSKSSSHAFDVEISIDVSDQVFMVKHFLCLTISGGWSDDSCSTADNAFPVSFHILCIPP
ncbi:hypothetical protein GUITHDRAFT_100612 [Guillardia theta CCMP2712]|uniref:Protein kinase domain-containing protein n=1 Tax=Guillardia theta (strain CCMP2712) TaxID=905079 RepID=L1JZS7_GUITC|nr:hypothetical protein GUITHDRAFT_100612 [Guillardia theta CCMP2712]EKX53628.1 hypothetical protein GUITHDRAFT_100612 [Guillardia theta CCMP2712]|eukprot:XP_005840608.1 hypothetical protein GUITHDRAFT_100612 [Guillardia theta CCMP2712]